MGNASTLISIRINILFVAFDISKDEAVECQDIYFLSDKTNNFVQCLDITKNILSLEGKMATCIRKWPHISEKKEKESAKWGNTEGKRRQIQKRAKKRRGELEEKDCGKRKEKNNKCYTWRKK